MEPLFSLWYHSNKKPMATTSLVINYFLWETQVLSLIESQDLLGFIIGTIPTLECEITGPNKVNKVPKLDLAHGNA